jgi:hypothetical protein
MKTTIQLTLAAAIILGGSTAASLANMRNPPKHMLPGPGGPLGIHDTGGGSSGGSTSTPSTVTVPNWGSTGHTLTCVGTRCSIGLY